MLTPPCPFLISPCRMASFSSMLLESPSSQASEKGLNALTASSIHASVKGLWSSSPALFVFSTSLWIRALVFDLVRLLSRTHSPVATNDNTHVALLDTEILFLPR